MCWIPHSVLPRDGHVVWNQLGMVWYHLGLMGLARSVCVAILCTDSTASRTLKCDEDTAAALRRGMDLEIFMVFTSRTQSFPQHNSVCNYLTIFVSPAVSIGASLCRAGWRSTGGDTFWREAGFAGPITASDRWTTGTRSSRKIQCGIIMELPQVLWKFLLRLYCIFLRPHGGISLLGCKTCGSPEELWNSLKGVLLDASATPPVLPLTRRHQGCKSGELRGTDASRYAWTDWMEECINKWGHLSAFLQHHHYTGLYSNCASPKRFRSVSCFWFLRGSPLKSTDTCPAFFFVLANRDFPSIFAQKSWFF